MTSLDTRYEYAGFRLSGELAGFLAGLGLPLLVGLAGTAWLVHALSSDRATVRDLAVHVLWLALAGWLLAPVTHQGVAAPRFASWLGAAADRFQRGAVGRMNERFLTNPFEFERVAALAASGVIHDPELSRDVARFLHRCARPALAREEPGSENLFRPGSLPYGPACEKERGGLWARLRDHARTHRLHRTVLDLVRQRTSGDAAAFEERYLDRMAVRAVDEPGSPTSESALVLASVGRYELVHPSQSSGGTPAWMDTVGSFLLGPLYGSTSRAFRDNLVDGTVSTFARISQDWSNRFTAKQRFFLATVFAPHLYGLTLLILLGFFPVVGLFALIPGKWTALVNYGKVFLSVKLWPVCWAALTRFNAKRPLLEALDPVDRGSGDAFLAVASMYLLTPVVAFTLVHLAAAAAAMPFSAGVPAAAGPGAGPVGPALGTARRIIR